MGIELRDRDLLREGCFINGAWVGAVHGLRLAVTDPASGEILARVPEMGVLETREAIAAAEAALPAWRSLTAKERAGLLKRWFELILAATDDLAMIMTREQGKPLAEAKGEVAYAASFIEWFAEEAKRVYGEIIPSPRTDARLLAIRQPVGVCAAITPWNFPAAMITRKAAPALAAGCTMVVKPAPQTPLTALALAELARRAGIPAGVFNVVTGPAEAVGGELTSNPRIRKISFTGSTPVGKLLMGQCAATVKKVSLELGGNAPFIVFEDADLDAAVAGALAAKFRNTGQTCVCVNRFLVQRSVHDAFAEKLARAVEGLVVGPGLDAASTQGPLIDERALAKVEAHLADALAKGARLHAGGRRHGLGGCFYQPTVISGATPDMLVAQDETFGPLAALFAFDSDAEAIRLANDTRYGLASYFYSRDLGRVWRVAEALDFGMVGINTGLISNEVAPFGGIKESGVGREGSRHGIEEYTEIKYLCMAGL
jgi:succinate-semialdehyde dehydrogenase/glutarate-semialdehyde dehydrogenase